MNLSAYEAYSTAWIVIGGAGFIGALSLNSLLKRIGGNHSVFGRSLRFAIVLTIFVAFVMPVSVPAAPQVFAPAFIVWLFEAFFQSQGNPEQAQRIMLFQLPLVLGGALILGIMVNRLLFRIRGRAAKDENS